MLPANAKRLARFSLSRLGGDATVRFWPILPIRSGPIFVHTFPRKRPRGSVFTLCGLPCLPRVTKERIDR